MYRYSSRQYSCSSRVRGWLLHGCCCCWLLLLRLAGSPGPPRHEAPNAAGPQLLLSAVAVSAGQLQGENPASTTISATTMRHG